MSIFKKGDRVRNIQPDEENDISKYYGFGETGTVDEDDSTCPYVIWDNGRRHPQEEGHIELITEEPVAEKVESGDKTTREWFNELPDEIRDRAIRNGEASDWNAMDNEQPDTTHALEGAFNWYETPEKDDYWYAWQRWLRDPSQPKPTIQPADGSGDGEATTSRGHHNPGRQMRRIFVAVSPEQRSELIGLAKSLGVKCEPDIDSEKKIEMYPNLFWETGEFMDWVGLRSSGAIPEKSSGLHWVLFEEFRDRLMGTWVAPDPNNPSDAERLAKHKAFEDYMTVLRGGRVVADHSIEFKEKIDHEVVKEARKIFSSVLNRGLEGCGVTGNGFADGFKEGVEDHSVDINEKIDPVDPNMTDGFEESQSLIEKVDGMANPLSKEEEKALYEKATIRAVDSAMMDAVLHSELESKKQENIAKKERMRFEAAAMYMAALASQPASPAHKAELSVSVADALIAELEKPRT